VLKGRHKLVCGHMSRSFPDVNTWVNFLELKSFFDDFCLYSVLEAQHGTRHVIPHMI